MEIFNYIYRTNKDIFYWKCLSKYWKEKVFTTFWVETPTNPQL